MRSASNSIFLATGFLICATASTASAHIDLFSPTPRYTKEVAGANKACPCGVGQSNRLCNVDGDRSDDNRAVPARVTTFEAESTITMRFEEYVGHSGRYRVAIDYDGADLEDFNQNVLIDIPDPSGSEGNIGQGSFWEIEVPLPKFNCDNCTLQLIQMMDGNTMDPVLDPVNRSSYYTCADISITGGIPRPSEEADAGPVVGVDAGPGANPDAGTNETASGSGCNSSGDNGPIGLLSVLFGLMAWTRIGRRNGIGTKG